MDRSAFRRHAAHHRPHDGPANARRHGKAPLALVLPVLIVAALTGLFAEARRGAKAGSAGFLRPSAEQRGQSEPNSAIAAGSQSGWGTDSEVPQRTKIPVRAGDHVIVGSLDESAQIHLVEFTWDPVLVAATQTAADVPTTIDFAIVASDELPPACVAEVSVRLPTDSPSLPAIHPAASVERTFCLPWFKNMAGRMQQSNSVTSRVARCRLISESRRVRVYAETADPAGCEFDADTIIADCESRVLPLVHQELHGIDDVDGDGKLSIVLCGLAEPGLSADPPIQGCVRASDFLNGDNELAGDIVYLDWQLARAPNRLAVLSHECAHAAVFSILRSVDESEQTESLPAWLHEAIAHSIESQRVPDSGNLTQRMDGFLEATHRYPLLVPNHSTGHVSGRGPERAAGLLFVRFLRVSNLQLTNIVRNPGNGRERIEQATGSHFDELFREWTLSLLRSGDSGTLPLTVHSLDQTRQWSVPLRGTAATWMRAETSGNLSMITRQSCCPQLTVVSRASHRRSSTKECP